MWLAVVAVVLLAEATARILAPYLPDPLIWMTPEAQHKASQIRARGPADVVLLGSSVMDAAGDPTAIARYGGVGGARRSVYNAALSGITLGAIAQWGEAFVEPLLKPRVVVLGLGFPDLNANTPGRVAGDARFADSAGMREATGTETLAQRIERSAGDVSELIRLRRVLMRPIASFRQGRRAWEPGLGGLLDPRLSDGGMSLTFVNDPYGTFDGKPLPPATENARVLDGPVHDFAVNGGIDLRLQELIRALRARSVAVVLVELPYSDALAKILPHGAADARALSGELAKAAAATGVRLVSAGRWSNRLFADPLHVNGAGALRLARLLGPAIWKASNTRT